jgi:hypothetical protein
LPGAVLAPTLMVIVDELPAVTEAGLKVTLVPAGAPLELSETVCAGPFVTAVPIVDVPFEPCTSVRLVGVADIEKSGGGGAVTVRLTAVECVALGPVPVTVIV